MKILVQKFGGTSVAGLERMERVLEIVRRPLDEGYKLVIVLSAMAGETNRLLALAEEWSANPNPAEMDVLVSTGEQVSVSLFTMLALDAGIKARSLLGHQIPVTTDDDYCLARIEAIDSDKLRGYLDDYDLLVVAGFQGCDCNGRITTLGRGGSDTSAVAMAAALSADACEIFTDVPGVFTTDPNICSSAVKLDKISYDEMLELASQGAKVLATRSVEFAKKYNVPVHVRSTFSDEPGTFVVKEDSSMEAVLVSGVAYDKDQARITVFDVPDHPGVAAAIFSPIADASIMVDMIVQNTSRDNKRTDMTFTVPRKDLQNTLDILKKVSAEISAGGVDYDTGVCKVSIIGVGMRNHSGVASNAFMALRDANVNILMISTSEIKVTCLIEEKNMQLAVHTLHEAFELGKNGAPAC
jgi:aspartate kinase